MTILSDMTDRTVMRGFPWIWFIRLAQIFISVLVLALAAVDAHAVQSLGEGCGTPPRIAFNLACAVLAIVALIYFIFATGPTNAFKSLPWLVWGQIVLDAFMLIFWLAASATSEFTYRDICAACSADGVYFEGSAYFCSGDPYEDGDIYTRDMSSLPRGLAGMEKRASGGRRGKRGTALGRSALDAIMTVLFAITLAATIWWVFTQRRSSGTAASTTKPPAHEESGVPMTSTQQPTPVASNPQTQPVQYYVVQGQPQQQQQQQQQQEQPYVYQQSVPQSQYPPQEQQQFVHQQQ